MTPSLIPPGRWGRRSPSTVDAHEQGLEVIEAHLLFDVDYDRSTSSYTRSPWSIRWSKRRMGHGGSVVDARHAPAHWLRPLVP